MRRKFLVIPVAVIILGAILEIWVVNRLSTYGDQIRMLEQNEANLRMENQFLENQIAEKSSLITGEKISKNLGYDKVKSFEYIKQENLALSH